MGTLPADATLKEVEQKIRAEGKDGGSAQLKVSTHMQHIVAEVHSY